ncbi:helix-turn-helix domain-containing protein [Cohnella sp.]|uniref:helix-turn-helix domain-containing protein n=1 Tax=Cohnella sp. TaxID=1883426 RepID=UPI003565D4C8
MPIISSPHDRPELPYATIFGAHFDEDDTYRTRRQNGMNDWLIVYTLGGEGYFQTPAGEKRCKAGQIALLRAGVPHEYGTVKGQRWNFLWAHFQKLSENDYLPDDEVLIHTLPDGSIRKRIYRTFLNLLHDSRDRSGFWNSLCENSLREIILLIAQRLTKKLDARIEHTLQLLSQSMKEEVRIEELAKAAGLSSSRLSHLFKQEMGHSIVMHLNKMRLRQAALLMEYMGRTATEASLDVGFNNYNHFAALFRRLYGVSPREYIDLTSSKRD